MRAHVEGTRRYYTLRRDDLEARFPGLLDSVLQAENPADVVVAVEVAAAAEGAVDETQPA